MSGGSTTVVDLLLKAIALEKAVFLAEGAPSPVLLRAGRALRMRGAETEYEFPIKGWPEELGDRVLVRPRGMGAAWTPALARRLGTARVRLTTTADLGRRAVEIHVCRDETALLDLLGERIAAEAGRPGSVDSTKAGWILGEGVPRIGRCADVDLLIPGYAELALNTRQRLAIEHALDSDVTFVWGPPGTGKTEVVARIVEGTHRQGLRVLLLAPTKVAVDQALERVCDILRGEEGFGGGLVQRAGDISLASLDERYGDDISQERIVAKLGAPLVEQRRRIEDQLADVRGSIGKHENAAATRELLDGLRLSRDEARRAPVVDAEETGRLERKIRVEENRIRSFGLGSLEPLERLRMIESGLTAELIKIDDEIGGIRAAVEESCRVMGTTVARAVRTPAVASAFDVVIIDEAGMVDLPSAWCAAGLASQRVVVAGDFRQLPSVTHGSSSRFATPEDRAHSAAWMDRDAFAAAGLVDDRGAAKPDSRMVCLEEQYRMRPAICEVVNEVAYRDAPLKTSRDDNGRLPPSTLLPGPLVLVDTSSRRLVNASDPHAHKTNPVHEAVIHELVRGWQFDGVLPTRKQQDLAPGAAATDRMAVIVPYRDQVAALRESLKERFGADAAHLVDTVHQFQGSQRPLVVLDTVAGVGRKAGYFYEGSGLSATSTRLLNVALSRAQDHLVVVADVDFLRDKVPVGGEVARMLRRLEERAHRLPVDALIPVRSAAELGGLSAEDLARPAFFPSDEVVRAIRWDIERAKRSIDVRCAFLDPTPTAEWLRHLSPRIADGVRVTVYTRKPVKPAAISAARHLEQAGCTVVHRPQMHEKVLIFDDEVLWHGSLNLLADRSPTDLMMRTADRLSSERVRRILAVARPDPRSERV
ncbi:AAA domain-containing protein [Saccharothrix deserti]|uniref:AAA domain-containing protein n=1 Tax=Saccharothrix deserti TaxID=2593674 RepID=UPI00131AC760|nr:AAA domain-containing protein [Saccharothrix deserti]